MALAMLACCAPLAPKPETSHPGLVRLNPETYPDFSDDLYLDGLLHGIAQSLSHLRRLPAEHKVDFGPDSYGIDHLIRSLETFHAFFQTNPDADSVNRFIRSRCRVYRASGGPGDGQVLFTGYYEPLLTGSRRQTPVFRHPIFGLPDNLIVADLSRFSDEWAGNRITGRIEGNTLVPYWDRAAIDDGDVLAGHAPVLAWLQDPVDLFFLQVQGSGKVFLEDGRILNVHYHGTNGRPYRSVGKVLIDQGAIAAKDMSMQAIRKYLSENPDRVRPVLHANPSYVFFKIEDTGPIGSLGVLLTPARSIATDRRLFPPAAIAYIETEKPLADGNGRIVSWRPLQRFVLNQDTGGAIRGPGRADLFWGNGPYAELAAGHMRHRGQMYFLVLNPRPPKP